jgi:hypothetical protein
MENATFCCLFHEITLSTSQTKYWSDVILGLASRGPRPKAQKVLSELMAGLDQLQIVIIGTSNKAT